MTRIAATFERLKAEGRKALIPYVTAGFPYADITPELMRIETGPCNSQVFQASTRRTL